MTATLPLPNIPITVRPAVGSDLPFIDSLQKMHAKMVGWMPTKQLEGKIAAGNVLVAEAAGSEDGDPTRTGHAPLPPAAYCPLPTPLGYLIAQDQYFKHDDVGIIYQLNVLPGRQRGLIGATLLKSQFERSAYGCKLYCCWCAQDIAANYFWEAMGFVPLAFRAGSEKRSRVHIFWQKRIRHGDTSTPWWFPSQTTGGSMMQDRLVFPIPPDSHWSDEKPLVLPKHTHEPKRDRLRLAGPDAAPGRTKPDKPVAQKILRPGPLCGGLSFSPPARPSPAEGTKKRERIGKTKMKNDPTFVAAARELRDRWLEKVNSGEYTPQLVAKYEVRRELACSDPNGSAVQRQLTDSSQQPHSEAKSQARARCCA